MLAIAIDLGTTTLAASLINTVNGERLASAGALNPQRRYGADLVSRLAAALHSETAGREMTTTIRAELSRLGRELCASASVAWDRVKRIAVAGNPAMQHLLLGLPVERLALPPFRPRITTGTFCRASELDWQGTASVYVFPMPGGFVGGDTVAVLCGQEHDETASRDGARLYLDLGTNGELALVTGETVWATSVAAGPAFEGGNLSCGMAALPGAISSVSVQNGRISTTVIGNGPPRGICGSAVLETVALLLDEGVLGEDGRIKNGDEIPSILSARVIDYHGERAFVLYRDAQRLLVLTQADIRQVQLANGAIRAGIEILFDKAELTQGALERVVLTGSFGMVLRPEWLKKFGVFAGSMVHIISFVSDGVIAGVEGALCQADGVAAAERLANKFRVTPLSGNPRFEKLFLESLNFPGEKPM